MGRQQRFDWFLSNQRIKVQGHTGTRGRRPLFETLEVRNFLSMNAPSSGPVVDSDVLSTAAAAASLQPEAMWASRDEYEASNSLEPAEFVAFDPWEDTDGGLPGITITYSYSNLLDGQLPGNLRVDQLTAATEEALGLWAEHAPIHFVELLDRGPAPDDVGYDGDGLPMLRIGHHPIDGGGGGVLAHAFFPSDNGLGGDVHFDSLDTWRVSPAGLGFDLIEVMTHELGHALGLGHEPFIDAIMNPVYGDRFDGPGTGFLLQDDINGIQELYGEGSGSVTPLIGLVVNTLEDVDDVTFQTTNGVVMATDGSPDTLSLREAISIAGSEGGVRPISFDRDIRGGTIVLDATLRSLEITSSLSINGIDSEITVSAANPDLGEGDGFRIFNIDNDDPMDAIADTLVDVSISGLTLTGGLAKSGPEANGGGAIFSQENLTLTDVTIVNNHSELDGGGVVVGVEGGLFDTSLTINNSTIENNTAEGSGGAVWTQTRLETSDSTYRQNHAEESGGAVFVSSSLGTIFTSLVSFIASESTFSENTAVEQGGAASVSGFVEVEDSSFTRNAAGEEGGAIYADRRSTVIDNSVFEANESDLDGGALYNDGQTTIRNSSLFMNIAGDEGGALFANSGATISSSSFYQNESQDDGGAIAAQGVNDDLIITNSTISGNTAGRNGGGIHIFAENPKRFRVLHSTVHDNQADRFGGGIYMRDGVLALEHSIVAGNADSGPAPDIDNVNFFALPIVLTRYSLIGDTDGVVLTQQGPNLLNMDAMLEPLADNGGPGDDDETPMLTHFPMSGSPVVNAGNPNVSFPPDFDQRGTGFDRVLEGVIDIGSIETGGFENTIAVNTLEDLFDIDEQGEDQTPETTSLREALYFADLDLGKTRIDFDSDLLGGIMQLDGSLGELAINTSTAIDASELILGLTISGAAADPTPDVKSGDGIRLVRVSDGDDENVIEAELVGIQFVGGDVTGDGGAIHSTESLFLRDVMILDSYATGNGGGVYLNTGILDSTLIIEGSTLARNHAGLDGGGLWTDSTMPSSSDFEGVKLLNATVSANIAGDEGGGIMNNDGRMEIRHTTITENQAAHGSGVVSYGDVHTTTRVYSSIISGNVRNPDDTGFDVQISRGLAHNAFVSLGYNMIGIGNAALNFDNDDLVEITDPQLRPLGNYGGTTLTHGLLPDSLAVEAGDPGLPNADYADGILAADPLLYWPFDEEVGSTAEDLAGDNDGTYGEEVDIDVGGARSETGRAIRLTGSEDLSSVQSDETELVATSSLGNHYSFSLWLNANTDDRLQMLLQLDDPEAAVPVEATVAQLRWSNGEIVVKGPNAEMSTDLELSATTWRHVVFVQDGDESRVYVNGTLEETVTGLDFEIVADTRVLLGNQLEEAEGTVEGFAGLLDEFIIYDSALKDQAVAILYRSSSTPSEDIVSFDQRGDTFDRIVDHDRDGEAIVDIGAYELTPPTPTADFDADGDVDGADFLAWQRGLGTSDAQRSDGDADFDRDVDADDLGTWTSSFGTLTPSPLRAGESPQISSPSADLPSLATSNAVVSSGFSEVSLPSGIVSTHEYSPRVAAISSDEGDRIFDDVSAEPVAITDTKLAEAFWASQQHLATVRRDAVLVPRDDVDGALDTAFERLDLEHDFKQYAL